MPTPEVSRQVRRTFEPDEDADEAHQLGRQFAGLVGPPLAIEEPEHDRENDADQDIGLALAIGPW